MKRKARPIKVKDPNGLLKRTAFFIGWLLSPFTFWNDAFVNIPLSYLAANILVMFVRIDFLVAVLIFYWISNIMGIAIMYFSGRMILAGKNIVREAVIFAATVLVYSIIVIALHYIGILRPLW